MHIIKRVYHSIKTAWTCKQNSAVYYEPQLRFRYIDPVPHFDGKTCIYMVDGTDYNPGLCDKLRGILSLFCLCQKSNLRFKINWVFPFELTDYLHPNIYDWTISKNDIAFCINTRPIVIDYAPYLLFQESIDRITFIRRILNSPYSQLHVYSNIIYQSRRFKENFNILFKASPQLSIALKRHKNELGNNYVSFSLRFMELLGDFKDQEGVSHPLSEKDQIELISNCASKLLDILNQQPKGTKAFVASDSKKFLEFIKNKDARIYTVDGEIVHVRYKGSESAYLKTFVDLFLIKDAATQYLLRTSLMYNSGFPRFASWIGNNNFKLIEF